MVLQLRGPHLHHARDHPSHRREGDRGARVGTRARRQDGAHPSRSGAGLSAAPARSRTRSSTRSGSASSTPTSWCPCTPRTAATRATWATGRARRRCCPSARLLPNADAWASAPPRTPSAALTCHGLLTRFPDAADRLHRERRRLGAAVPRPSRGHVRARCRRHSPRTRSMPSSGTCTSARSTRTTSRRSPGSSARTTCSSARTTRIRRGLPSRAATSTTFPKNLSEEDVAKIMGGNLARIMRVGVTV